MLVFLFLPLTCIPCFGGSRLLMLLFVYVKHDSVVVNVWVPSRLLGKKVNKCNKLGL